MIACCYESATPTAAEADLARTALAMFYVFSSVFSSPFCCGERVQGQCKRFPGTITSLSRIQAAENPPAGTLAHNPKRFSHFLALLLAAFLSPFAVPRSSFLLSTFSAYGSRPISRIRLKRTRGKHAAWPLQSRSGQNKIRTTFSADLWR